MAGPSTAVLRRNTNVAVGQAQRELKKLIRGAKTPEAAARLLTNALPEILQLYGPAVSTMAADWYDDVRDANSVARRFRAIIPEMPQELGTDELIGWGLHDLFGDVKPDWVTAEAKISGGMQRRILDQSRNTIMRSSEQDPSASGWERVLESDACDFCRMLQGRGTVYSKEGVDFGSHDNCECSAAPAFGGTPIKVKQYKLSDRHSDSSSSLARDWMEENL